MLQNIRANSKGTLAKIIIGLIVVSFSIFGIESLLVGGGSDAVAEVNGEELSPAEVQQTVNLQKRRLLSMLGDNADPALLDDERLVAQAIDGLIERKLLVQAARKQGLVVADSDVGAIIASMEQFQMDGQFSAPLYQNTLASAGYTPALFQRSLREDLLLAQLRAGLSASEFATPTELGASATVTAEQRDIRYIMLPLNAFNQIDQVSDDDIQAYYDANSDEFMSPESVDISFIELNADAFREPVSEKELREAFELAKQDAQYQTESRVAHILLEQGSDESESAFSTRIEEAQKAINDGMPFDEAAAMYSDDVGSADFGGDLGFTAGDTFPEPMEEAIAALEPGQISAPVETDAGIHLIKVVERRAGESIQFEDMRAELEQQIQSGDARRELLLAVEQLRDLVFNAEDLSGPAEEMDLEVETADNVLRGNQEGIFGDPALQSAIFSEDVLEFRHNSEVVEMDSDRFIVVHVDDYSAPEALPLEQVRERIASRIAAERARELSSREARAIIARLEAGETMEQVAQDLDYEWQVELGTTRSSGRLPAVVSQRGFALPGPQGQPLRDSARADNGDLYVVELSRVKPGQLAALDTEQRTRLADRIAGEYAGMVQRQFEKRLRDQAEVTVY
ncbi:SurA N-terminal domain-containing protein [Chromatocurvus halotolerans]|uniref:Periplasmic chaperone PpiD n=1 Tax=Chromatocurvus halotolerans TaxID=1132028 RepID=A0A4R2KPF9_9GAMM|nr:SurA N-terminal domain-containing protein [Chromatocurvus halotolerans]TCO72746.1 peptidyl-prolyl cis-trans isomerase D [Chromatocurvus halotolerans]